MIVLSKAAIEAMGFACLRDGEVIEARFHSLNVFEVRGFTIKDESPITHEATVSGVPFSAAIASSVNSACRALLGDGYTDAEDQWAKDRNCTPPYVVVLNGPTDAHKATSCYAMSTGQQIHTYDAFAVAKEEVQTLEATTLPPIEAALACVLSSREHTVELVHVDRTVFGITPQSSTVHDIRITGSAKAYVSKPLTPAELNTVFAATATLAARLEPRVARFFQLGAREADGLKRFLYYFLAIEVAIHAAFKRSTKQQHISNATTVAGRVTSSVLRLLEHRDNWTALADRFVWCVSSEWTHMGDPDIDEFRRLKRVRDGIAHGEIANPAGADVKAVEALAKKLYS